MLWIGTSWKMNGTLDFAASYANALVKENLDELEGIQPFIIPPFTALAQVRDILGDRSGVLLGAQNAHWEDAGAWTGEISMPQAADAGASIIEIGHSERREFFNETDETVNLKTKAALAHGLIPLVCFGEPLEVFNAGDSIDFITAQIDAALDGIDDRSGIVLAYEPIWAIGEHGRQPRPEDLQKAFDALGKRYGGDVRAILYGGSVNHDNNAWLLDLNGVDGLFIGRSAWTPEGYIKHLRMVEARQ